MVDLIGKAKVDLPPNTYLVDNVLIKYKVKPYSIDPLDQFDREIIATKGSDTVRFDLNKILAEKSLNTIEDVNNYIVEKMNGRFKS